MTNTASLTLLSDHSEPATPASQATLHVVVVDSQAPVREGLPLLLRAEAIDVRGVASTGAAGEALIEQHAPDVALVGLDLSDVDGFSLLRRLVRRGVRSAIVLYTAFEDGAEAALAMHAGAAGVICKHRTIAELAQALRAVAGGGIWFGDRTDMAPPAPAYAPEPPPSGERRTAALSSAELRVLALVAEGRSTEEAAEALSLSPHTVRTHLRNVMRKLQASSRAHAVAIAMREAAIGL